MFVDVERSHIHSALSLAGFEHGHVQVFALAWVQRLERRRKSSGTGLRTSILSLLKYSNQKQTGQGV